MDGVLWAAALLLGAAGIGKLFRPGPTSRAIIAAEIPGATLFSTRPVVRLIGLAELITGVVVVTVGGPLSAALLAVSYLLLAGVAWRMIRLAPDQDCGCFGGASEEPSSWWHVGVNLGGVAIGVVRIAWPPETVGTVLESQGLQGILLFGGSVLLAAGGYLLLTALPALARLRAKVAAS